MIETESKLSELASIIKRYPQALINVKVDEKPPLDTLTKVQEKVRQTEEKLGSQGRVLLRYSGTEQICRVMVEGPTRKEVNGFAEALAKIVEAEIGEKAAKGEV
jgi:phosphoglucosamine mutase